MANNAGNAQRLYKNNLFTDYFLDKERLIDAYNALSGENYPLDTEIEYETLDNVLFTGMYNDIAFSIEGRYVVLLEHQSTLSDNLCTRLLLYVARVYEQMIDTDALYKRAIHKIPTPQFIVVYNGRADYPDKHEMYLSDAFIAKDDTPCLELKATVYNVAAGHNEDMLAKSTSLHDYAAFCSLVERLRADGHPLEEAIAIAVTECEKAGIMAAYLKAKGSEVVNMLLTEWNMEDALRVAREEEREAGIAYGINAAKREDAKNMKADGLDVDKITKYTGLSPAEVKEL
jgi:hypothetical protein